jgi:hypothetical protein
MRRSTSLGDPEQRPDEARPEFPKQRPPRVGVGQARRIASEKLRSWLRCGRSRKVTFNDFQRRRRKRARERRLAVFSRLRATFGALERHLQYEPAGPNSP